MTLGLAEQRFLQLVRRAETIDGVSVKFHRLLHVLARKSDLAEPDVRRVHIRRLWKIILQRAVESLRLVHGALREKEVAEFHQQKRAEILGLRLRRDLRDQFIALVRLPSELVEFADRVEQAGLRRGICLFAQRFQHPIEFGFRVPFCRLRDRAGHDRPADRPAARPLGKLAQDHLDPLALRIADVFAERLHGEFLGLFHPSEFRFRLAHPIQCRDDRLMIPVRLHKLRVQLFHALPVARFLKLLAGFEK